ncbi:MAG TPA: type II toxin-antitoxin system VapC family toxin [Pseudolysinimonas sp.]|nr:type II toxin-antitoxin system VapC family toxin [Pseudolysinimonas sp.]
MRYLLDTGVLLFWAMGRLDRLTESQQSVIRDGGNEVFVSAVSAAEVRVKTSIGKLSPPPGLFESLASRGFVELPLTIADSDAFDTLPLVHRDPFDRLLVIQALAHGLTLVTTDDQLRQYPIPTL